MDNLVPGGSFGLPEGEEESSYCYLPLFKSVTDHDTWHLGSMLLNKYVLEFTDSSVGIGLETDAAFENEM